VVIAKTTFFTKNPKNLRSLCHRVVTPRQNFSKYVLLDMPKNAVINEWENALMVLLLDRWADVLVLGWGNG